MGTLTDDMGRLAGEIDVLHSMRKTFINDLKQGGAEMKADVAGMRLGFRNDHAKMTRKMKGDLETFLSGMKNKVSDLVERFRNERVEMAGETKAELLAFLSEIKKFVSNLSDNVAGMRLGFRNDHAEVTRKMKGDLETFLSGMKNKVSDLVERFRNERVEMAGETKAELLAFLSEIKKFVSNLHQKTTDLRKEFTTDIIGARRSWLGPSPVEHRAEKKVKRLAGKGAEHIAVEEAELQLEEAESKRVEERTVDAVLLRENFIQTQDLTEIQGIGSGRNKLLNEAGIHTFAQLARSTPEKLQRILGESSSRLANVEKWIEQAKKLAK